MGARNKLNGMHLTGSIVVAGVIGAVVGSFAAFVLALTGLVFAQVLSGTIRP